MLDKIKYFLLIMIMSFFSTSVTANYDKLAYDFNFNDLDGSPLNLTEYKNKVIAVVNVASQCGYTYQYEALQALYEQHKDDGFVVLGFPSGDFFQEFTEEEKVKEFCQTTYGVDFPMFKRSHVTNGGKLRLRNYKANPFFAELIKKTGVQPAWNFNKYLIARDGSVKHYNEKVEPDSTLLTSEIVALISK